MFNTKSNNRFDIANMNPEMINGNDTESKAGVEPKQMIQSDGRKLDWPTEDTWQADKTFQQMW